MNRQFMDMISNHYKGYYFLFFHGSRTTQLAKEDSDYDVIIVYKENIKPFREKFKCGEFEIDAFIYDEESLHFELLYQFKNGNSRLSQILSKSIVLPEKKEESVFLINIANELLKIKHHPSVSLLIRHRISLRNTIRDIENSSFGNARIILSICLIKHVMEVLLLLNNKAGEQRKFLTISLEECEEKFFNEIYTIFSNTIINNDFSTLITMAEDVIARLPEDNTSTVVYLPERGRIPLKIAR